MFTGHVRSSRYPWEIGAHVCVHPPYVHTHTRVGTRGQGSSTGGPRTSLLWYVSYVCARPDNDKSPHGWNTRNIPIYRW